ncbi:MAG TPA: peptide-methionine (S)-S-oxide reductase MsrA [Terriglobales bacterium]|nr:peptide-methionine (S)-S-oxide reductase MsrA [Terriglobales bacterium]
MSTLRIGVVVGLMLAVGLGFISFVNRGARAAAGANLPAPTVDEARATHSGRESIVLSGGCFWGVQLVFENVRGVVSATDGYAGGQASTAEYETVSTGLTGHAESVQVVYDPSKVTLGELLQVFFSVAHNPTELNRQGPDTGTQYRSAIFYSNPDQERIAKAYIDQLEAARIFQRPIVTQLNPLHGFYRAEDYHQDYAVHNPDNPYIRINDLPKLAALRAQWPALAKH